MTLPSFFTVEMMGEFWGYVKWLLYVGMPLLMIYAALQTSDRVVHFILDIFYKKKKDDDDDGYDIYRY